jgi:hypothetical protein
MGINQFLRSAAVAAVTLAGVFTSSAALAATADGKELKDFEYWGVHEYFYTPSNQVFLYALSTLAESVGVNPKHDDDLQKVEFTCTRSKKGALVFEVSIEPSENKTYGDTIELTIGYGIGDPSPKAVKATWWDGAGKWWEEEPNRNLFWLTDQHLVMETADFIMEAEATHHDFDFMWDMYSGQSKTKADDDDPFAVLAIYSEGFTQAFSYFQDRCSDLSVR